MRIRTPLDAPAINDRAHVEHVFAAQKQPVGLFVPTISIDQAQTNVGMSNVGMSNVGMSNVGMSNVRMSNVGMSNVAHNMQRLVRLNARTASA